LRSAEQAFNRRDFLEACGVSAVGALLGPGLLRAADGATPPNVVVILLDDAGYSDFGFMGAEIETPAMDRLARNGVLLTQFYNNAQCVPTRGSLLHGMSAHGCGYGTMRSHPNPKSLTGDDAYVPLRRGVVSIAEALSPQGYQTYAIGKWHLGGAPGLQPLDRGFQRFYGFLSGASQFSKEKLSAERVKNAGWRLDATPLDYDKDFPAGFYATDAFTDHAIEFVKAGKRDAPFFLYLAYNAPHWPLEAPDELVAKYQKIYANADWQALRRRRFEQQKALGLLPASAALPEPWPRSLLETPEERAKNAQSMATYAAMIERVDHNVARLMKALEKRGGLDNTLVFLLSDNGADTVHGDGWMQVNNAPFRLCKTFAHEGGGRTPLVACWPARLPAGKVNTRQYGHVQDLLPTILAAAGATLPENNPRGEVARPLEGQSILPALLDPASARNRPLAFERMGNEMIRDGDWKLVRRFNFELEDKKRGALFHTTGSRKGQWELYHLADDPTETRDLAAGRPDKVAELSALYEAWAKRVGVIDREIQSKAENTTKE